MRFPHLAHRSAAAHKLHSTPQQDGMNLISGNDQTSSRLPPLAYSSPEAVQTTGTVAKTGIPALPPLAISIQQKTKDFVVIFEEALPPKSDVELDFFQIRNVPPNVIEMYPDVESIQPFLWVSSEVSSLEVPWSFMIDCPNVERLRSVSSTP